MGKVVDIVGFRPLEKVHQIKPRKTDSQQRILFKTLRPVAYSSVLRTLDSQQAVAWVSLGAASPTYSTGT